MKILNAAQIREWDSFTIANEPVSSLALMERAASACADWLGENAFLPGSFIVVCGKGNNGGDGLALARILFQRQCEVSVYILEFGHLGTDDFQANLERLHQFPDIAIKFIQQVDHFPGADEGEIIIDALFGSGLNRPLEGLTAQLVEHINACAATIIAIDVPSGLPVDHSPTANTIVRATHTLSFQIMKLAFLMPQNAGFVGKVHILDIGLDPEFYHSVETALELVDRNIISSIYRPRGSFTHKGHFGHALIVAGSYGKMGAAILCNRACLRSGAGLTTSHVPRCGYEIMQTAVPELMVSVDADETSITIMDENPGKFNCLGIGPGIGTSADTKNCLVEIFRRFRMPMVLDADALNILSGNTGLMKQIPPNSVLTPHPKEFDRLFGKTVNDFERLDLALQKAKELQVVIVLKGHKTAITTPTGKTYFNSTGNPGLAKGGSGDVLTGIITALVCQNYPTIEAAILGVYLHGLAADLAAIKHSQEALIASDVVDSLGEAFVWIASPEASEGQ